MIAPINEPNEFQLFVYTFLAFPEEGKNFDQAVYTLFELMDRPVEVVMIEEAFNEFRKRLAVFGITLNGIVRVPFCEEEMIE